MSKDYKFKHAIGDLVYTANKHGFDRDIIKAIKVVTLKENVLYGIESKKDGYSLFGLWGATDSYNWYKSSEIFKDKESAEAWHENLKTKYEAEEAVKKNKEIAERKAELQRKLDNLENGKSEYDDEYDD